MTKRYKLYNYAMPEYETLIIDTKNNNFVKYNKLLEIINHSDISEFVKKLNKAVEREHSEDFMGDILTLIEECEEMLK